MNCFSEFFFRSLHTADAKIFRNVLQGPPAPLCPLHAPLASLLPSFPRCIPPSFSISPSFCEYLFICLPVRFHTSLFPSGSGWPFTPLFSFLLSPLPSCPSPVLSPYLQCLGLHPRRFPAFPASIARVDWEEGREGGARWGLHCRLRGVTTPQQRQLFAKCCRRAAPAGEG